MFDVLANRLARRNIDVTKTYCGQQAIQALRGEDFDVAVLDLKMEDMDGIEVLKILKKMALDWRSSCSPVTAPSRRPGTA